jgi:hypothetical protein
VTLALGIRRLCHLAPAAATTAAAWARRHQEDEPRRHEQAAFVRVPGRRRWRQAKRYQQSAEKSEMKRAGQGELNAGRPQSGSVWDGLRKERRLDC